MAIKDALLDQLLEGYQKPEDLLDEGGIFQEFKKALIFLRNRSTPNIARSPKASKPRTKAPYI